jgi:hypothetical protein
VATVLSRGPESLEVPKAAPRGAASVAVHIISALGTIVVRRGAAMTQRVHSEWRAAVAVLLAVVPVAFASISDPAVVITASNANGTGQLAVPLSQFTYYPEWGEWDYVQSEPVDLWAGGQYVAQVEYLAAYLLDSPYVGPSITLQYTLRAGASVTSFWVDAGPVYFTAIPASSAAASMSDMFTLLELGLDADHFARLAALDNYAYQTFHGRAGSPTEYFFHGSDSLGSVVGNSEGAVYSVYDNWPLIPGAYGGLGIGVDRIRDRTAISVSLLDMVQVTTTLALASIPAPDCNANGVPDDVDIASGTSQDANHNYIPDECERHTGDLNCDGTYGHLSFADISPFVLYLADLAAWQATYPDCPPVNGDINGDGMYPSFADIDPFVALLSGR